MTQIYVLGDPGVDPGSKTISDILREIGEFKCVLHIKY